VKPVPSVGLLGSMLYLRDPQRLVARGRRLGPVWRFHHISLGPIPVVSDRAMAEEVFAAALPVSRSWRYTPWLGAMSPLTTTPPRTAVRQQIAELLSQALASTDPRQHILTALAPARTHEVDVGPGLRRAALAWLVESLCQTPRCRTVLAAAEAWSVRAATLPLLVPFARHGHAGWSGLASARARLIGALAEHSIGAALDTHAGAWLSGAVLALLGPFADALAMLAMSVLAMCDPYPEMRIARALGAPPMPLVIFEADRYAQLRRAALQLDVWPCSELCDGSHVAVDLGGAGLPFGAGLGGPLLRDAAHRFMSETITLASELDLTASGDALLGRRRLCFGPVRLDMSRWAG